MLNHRIPSFVAVLAVTVAVAGCGSSSPERRAGEDARRSLKTYCEHVGGGNEAGVQVPPGRPGLPNP
jgi:hypothetical protein